MSSFTYLITGAPRGLGLSYTSALLALSPSNKVIATARKPDQATELKALAAKKENEGRLLVVELNVSSEESVKALAAKLADHPFVQDGIDSLINNAGAIPGGWNTILQADTAEIDATLATNFYGPYWVTRELLPFLRKGKGKQIIMISSVAGSLGEFVSGMTGVATYAISKAALNMLMVKLARELETEDFAVVSFHPGYVKTDINQGGGEITVEEATKGFLQHLLPNVKKENTAKFFNIDGTIVPW